MPVSNPVHRAIETLIQHLEVCQDHGQEFVWITPQARKQLRHLPETLREKAAASRSAPAPAVQPTSRVAETPASPANSESVEPALDPEGSTKEEKITWLQERAKDWPPARALDSLRETMVFAVGNPDADLMLVGEAPGAEEERQQEPFVGPAGQKLTKIIGAMGLKREEVYISNIVKFRPALPNQGRGNRKPTPAEMDSCIDFVMKEIEIVEPKVIVALGKTAAEGLLGLQQSLSRMRNQFHTLEGRPVMVTYHPSYLLHNEQLSEKRKVWEDMLMVMERMGLPISEKQHGFFLKK